MNLFRARLGAPKYKFILHPSNFILIRRAAFVLICFGRLAWGQTAEPALPSQQAPSAGDETEIKLIVDDIGLVSEPSKGAAAPVPAYQLKMEALAGVRPILPPLDLPASGASALSLSARIHVKEFKFEGNHVFSSRTLARVIAGYAGREISSEELEQARQDLTLYYVKNGYLNSGAVLEDQDIADGKITFHLVEGRLGDVNITGNAWFRGYWLRRKLRAAGGRPLNVNHLKEGLQLLRQNPTISRINAELIPSGKTGESILEVQLKDEHPFRFGTLVSNKRPPSVGAELMELYASDLNLTGHNDVLDLQWGIGHTSGEAIRDGIEFSGDKDFGGSYAFPVTPWGTTFQLHADKNDSAIIENPFSALDIKSRSWEYGATIRQPVVERLNGELAFTATLDKRHSETFLLNEPFSLSAGEINGVMDVTVLRLGIEAVVRSQVHVLALRNTFNIGLDAFDATRGNGTTRDGKFFSWVGQSQYVGRILNTDNLLVVRLTGQLSNDQLLSLEQLAIGGMTTVRGYRENQMLRDNGVFGSIEFRVPVLRGKTHAPILYLAPFIDVGTGWNIVSTGRVIGSMAGVSQEGADAQRALETLESAGIGLIFNPTKYINAQVYWGYGFNRKAISDGHNLQDYGIHFSITVNAF